MERSSVAQSPPGRSTRPTEPWKSTSPESSALAGVVLLLIFILVLKQSNQAIGLFPVVIVFYTVVSYYMDRWMYERRKRSKAKGTGGGGEAA